MKPNGKYADTVFRKYFSNPHRLIELYNSVNDTHLPDDTPIDINTLDDVLYKDRMNDVSFVINDELIVLLEHQSTVNENMPLRMLMYIGRLYEKYIESTDRNAIYRKKQLKIPTPKFYVLYTGEDRSIPRKQVVKLSDAFKVKEATFSLDLTVEVYNLIQEVSDRVIIMGESVRQYALFIHQVHKELKKRDDPNDAFNAAIALCIRNDVMRQFLQENSTEVNNMLLAEWNMDDALKVSRDEGFEEGVRQEQERAFIRDVKLLYQFVTQPNLIAQQLNAPIEKVKDVMSQLGLL